MAGEGRLGLFAAIRQSIISAYVSATLQSPTITAKESFDFWAAAGAPYWVVWALLGNEQRETGFNWLAIGDKVFKDGVLVDGAYSIQQAHKPRRADILAGTGIDLTSKTLTHLDALKAMKWELTKGPKIYRLWDALLATKTIEDACDVLVLLYERAKQTDRDITLQIGFAKQLQAAHPDWMAEV